MLALIQPWLSDALERPVRLERVGENVHIVAEAPDPRVLVLKHFDTVGGGAAGSPGAAPPSRRSVLRPAGYIDDLPRNETRALAHQE